MISYSLRFVIRCRNRKDVKNIGSYTARPAYVRKYSVTYSPSNINDENKRHILEILNGKEEELARYKFSVSQIKELKEWKSINGKLLSIDQILEVTGFRKEHVDRVIQSYGKISDNGLNSNKKLTRLTIPALTVDRQKKLKSCISIHIGISSISWAGFSLNTDRPCDLIHWQHYDFLTKKVHLNDIIEQCMYIDNIIPKSDCYVFENPEVAQQGTPGNAAKVNINVQKAQVTAMLCYTLRKRDNFEQKKTDLYFLKRFLSSRLFSTLVGGERVSTEQVILNLLNIHYNLEDAENDETNNVDKTTLLGKVVVPFELRNLYNNMDGYQREFMGQTLLQGLTFIRLCLLKCPHSLSNVR